MPGISILVPQGHQGVDWHLEKPEMEVRATRRGDTILVLQPNGTQQSREGEEIVSYMFNASEAAFALGDSARRTEIAERGGSKTNTGTAWVVCNTLGRQLKPYWTAVSGPVANKTQAMFAVPDRLLVEIRADRVRREMAFEMYLWVRDETAAWPIPTLTRLDLWEGTDLKLLRGQFGRSLHPTLRQMLPDDVRCYEAAFDAARRKASCFHCRDVHFADPSYPRDDD